MYVLKTKVTDRDVEESLNSISDDKKKEDCLKLYDLFSKWTKEKPKLWGDDIVGFGSYHYKTKSGCEGDWFLVGFSPKKNYLSVYVAAYVDEVSKKMNEVGKAKLGKGCINAKTLENLNLDVLEEIVKLSIKSP